MNEIEQLIQSVKILTEKVDVFGAITKEIHQRQQELTLPKIEALEEAVYGNGKSGICEDLSCLKIGMAKNTTQIVEVEGRIDRLDVRFWYLIGGFLLSVMGFFLDRFHR